MASMKKGLLLSIRYSEIRMTMYSECYIVSYQTKFGICNINKGMILPIKYDEIEEMDSGFFKLRLGSTYSYVDNVGKIMR